MRFRNALGASFATAIALTAAIAIGELSILHFPHLQNQKIITTDQLTQLIKNALAIVAGAGALIALVTTYRRQKTTERADSRAQEAEIRAQETEIRARDADARARDAEIRAQETHDREQARIYNERFTTAASQLADPNPAIRIAGIYAMASLADDWETQRQTCIDVLCANLRNLHPPKPDDGAPHTEKAAWHSDHEARRTLIRIITAHLQVNERRAPTHTIWSLYNLDFTGVTFDGADFENAIFIGNVNFNGAQFSEGTTSFSGAQFLGGAITFNMAKFSGGLVFFDAEFAGGNVSFGGAEFTGGTIFFRRARFTGSDISFENAKFSGSNILFNRSLFSGGAFDLGLARFTSGIISFPHAKFAGTDFDFKDASFRGGRVDFGSAQFIAGTLRFNQSRFKGGTVIFSGAEFSGSMVDFSEVRDWSVPPQFDHADQPPPGLHLPVPGSVPSPPTDASAPD